jgi:hypothetical protein
MKILPLALALAVVTPQAVAQSDRPTIVTSDVDKFYQLYDAAGGHPTASGLQREYIDAGSPGLADFVRLRGLTGASLAAAIEADPKPFEVARSCVTALPRVRARLARALATLKQIYPRTITPPVTVLVGRAKTGGTTSKSGVLIGIETLCGVDILESDREDRLVHVIAHEYAHVQQPSADDTDHPGASVLFASLIEGGAEFVGEMISGGVSYPHLRTWTRGREQEIMARFIADRDATKLEDWLYQGFGTPQKPGDLGYWTGYRINKAFYDRSPDKRDALAMILEVTPATAPAILRGSGFMTVAGTR